MSSSELTAFDRSEDRAPLSGCTIVDLSRVLSGPFATQQLFDLGATVIKIEHPQGDDTRGFGPPFIQGESTYFMSINRGKKSVAIDLKHEKGRNLVLDLVRGADVLIENFKPKTAERLGFGKDALQKLHPKLITCSISGYGEWGLEEFVGRGGYDAIIQATSGIMSLTGPENGSSFRVGVAISDLIAGLYAVQGILAALYAQKIDGLGRHVEISMQEAMCALLTYQAGIYFATAKAPPKMGNAHPSICPYETIDAADGPIMLAVGNDAQFGKLARAISMPELAEDARFSTNRERVQHRDELLALLRPAIAKKTMNEWDRLLANEGIPGGPVLDLAQAIEHPQLLARKAILEHEHPKAGAIKSIGSPVRMSHHPRDASVAPPPLLGEHTREVLKDRLSLTDEAVDELVALGVVCEP